MGDARFKSGRPNPPLDPGGTMPRALKVCSRPGCPNLTTGGRCDECRAEAEQARGSARDRGYGRAHKRHFRRGVLRAHPLCQCEGGCCAKHTHGPDGCLAPSTDADHWPRDKRELRQLGLDEHDPRYGRGLCGPCHKHHTAHNQPGGWNAR